MFPDDRPMPDADAGYRGPTAHKAAGISYRQLDYWARTGLVVPSVRDASGSGTQRLYSFRDILVLKVVKRLLDAGVSLQNIRNAIEHLRSRGVEDLARITLMSDGATVYECTSADEVTDLLAGRPGRVRHRRRPRRHRGAGPARGTAGREGRRHGEPNPADELGARRRRRRASGE